VQRAVVVLALLLAVAAAPGAHVQWLGVPASADSCPAGPVRRSRHLPPPHVLQPSVIRVVDGDTFHAGTLAYRLRGIDTPEWGQPNARLAARRLAALLAEGPVLVVPRARDVYERIVADVCVAGRDVAAVLRREGFAKWDNGRGWRPR
jgi:endonuclease YncB( thermonuclease family)